MSRNSGLHRTLCVFLIVSLIGLPVHATLGEAQQEMACQQAPGFLETRTASVDAAFIRVAAVDKLRPVGAAVALLDDGSSVVTSIATKRHERERSGVLFLRRDALYAPGSGVPGLLWDFRLGMDPNRDVLWVKVRLSLPGDSSAKSASLEYKTEYAASELPEYQTLGEADATALLTEWATTTQPLLEQATVVVDGVEVVSEEGTGSFERAVGSFASGDRVVTQKSRKSCKEACAKKHFGPSITWDVKCVIAHALVCMGVCYVSLGTACATCLWSIDKLCQFVGSIPSIFQYLKCIKRC